MAYVLLSHTASPSTNGNDVTTGSIDTSGAHLLVVITYSDGTSPGSATDNKGNTFTLGYTKLSGGVYTRLFFCSLPGTVGSGHTFSVTDTGGAPSIAALAFSNSGNGSAIDQTNGAQSATSGSITPSEDNELLIAGDSGVAGEPSAINSSFTLDDTVTHTANALGAGSAHQIQTTATARNPTWTVNNADNLNISIIVSIKSVAAPGPTSQLDWPNPVIARPNRHLIGIDSRDSSLFLPAPALVFYAYDWPNPTLRVYPSHQLGYTPPSLQLTTLPPPPFPTVHTHDWTNPVLRTYPGHQLGFAPPSLNLSILLNPALTAVHTHAWPNPVRRTVYEAWRWTIAHSMPLALYSPLFPLPTDAIVLINSVNRTSDVDLASIEVTDNVNEEPNTCTLKIRNTAPTVGQDIQVGVGSISSTGTIFAGTITDVEQGYDQTPLGTLNIVWTVTCIDYVYLLNRRRPYGVFSAVSASTVFTTLISSYSSGFTSVGVPLGLPAITISFDGSKTLSQCFTDAANLIGYHWDVSYTKDIQVYTTRSGVAPAVVDLSNITVQANPEFKYKINIDQIRTRVYGNGPVTTAILGFISGDTVIPVANAAAFSSSGGSIISGRTPSGATTDVFTYTGKQAGGATTATTMGASLTPAPPTLAISSTLSGGIPYSSGSMIQYGVAFGTATGIGGLSGGGLQIAATNVGLSGSASATNATVTGGGLTAGSYDYGFTIQTSNGEGTIATTASVTVTNNAVTITNPSYSDGRITGINIYRSKVGGGTRYYVTTLVGSGTTWSDVMADIALGGRTAPATDKCQGSIVSITNIPVSGDSRVTARLIYRTLPGGSIFRLVATLGDNTTTVYDDSTTDTNLGAPAASGSTISIPVGSTTLSITDLAQVPASGYVTIGEVSTIKYTGRTAASGAGDLTGVPASGTGSITAAVKFGSSVSITPQLTGVSGVTNTVLAGSTVAVRVQVDDLAAQAAMALLEGGDGIHEYQFTDTNTTAANLLLEAQAQLDLFKSSIITVAGGIRDTNVNSGKFLTVNLAAPMSISVSLMLQTVVISRIGVDPGQYPLYSPTASSIKFTFQDLIRQLGGLVGP